MVHIFARKASKHIVLTTAIFSALSVSAHAQTIFAGSDTWTSSSLVGAILPADPGQQGGPVDPMQGPPTYPYIVQEKGSYWHGHAVDLAVSATGRFQQVVTTQQPNLTSPTEGVGVLTQLRAHPVSGFGLEVDYSYNRYTDRYSPATGTPVTRVQQDQHEATAGYVFHFRAPYVQPFVVVGGGALYLKSIKPNLQYGDQWRGTYMYGVGFDFVSKKAPHLAFRVQEHGLFYKSQDFYQAELRSNGYIHEAMPSAGLVYRF